jgi:hypothetical protein
MIDLLRECTKIDSDMLDNVIGKKTYREFIQFLLLKNKKGENGLIVKKLREFLSEEEEEIITQKIESFNETVNDLAIWEKPASEIISELDDSLKQEKAYIQSHRACYLLLFTMNYVFFCYANKSFRKFLGIQMRSFLNKN